MKGGWSIIARTVSFGYEILFKRKARKFQILQISFVLILFCTIFFLFLQARFPFLCFSVNSAASAELFSWQLLVSTCDKVTLAIRARSLGLHSAPALATAALVVEI